MAAEATSRRALNLTSPTMSDSRTHTAPLVPTKRVLRIRKATKTHVAAAALIGKPVLHDATSSSLQRQLARCRCMRRRQSRARRSLVHVQSRSAGVRCFRNDKAHTDVDGTVHAHLLHGIVPQGATTLGDGGDTGYKLRLVLEVPTLSACLGPESSLLQEMLGEEMCAASARSALNTCAALGLRMDRENRWKQPSPVLMVN